MSPTMSRTLRQPHLWPALAVALMVPLAAGGSIAQGSSVPTKAPATAVSKSDQEIIDTLQLAYRWGYPLMAMATNNRETYGSTTNAFYNMKTAADEKLQRQYRRTNWAIPGVVGKRSGYVIVGGVGVTDRAIMGDVGTVMQIVGDSPRSQCPHTI